MALPRRALPYRMSGSTFSGARSPYLAVLRVRRMSSRHQQASAPEAVGSWDSRLLDCLGELVAGVVPVLEGERAEPAREVVVVRSSRHVLLVSKQSMRRL